jgi:hypothetical protein
MRYPYLAYPPHNLLIMIPKVLILQRAASEEIPQGLTVSLIVTRPIYLLEINDARTKEEVIEASRKTPLEFPNTPHDEVILGNIYVLRHSQCVRYEKLLSINDFTYMVTSHEQLKQIIEQMLKTSCDISFRIMSHQDNIEGNIIVNFELHYDNKVREFSCLLSFVIADALDSKKLNITFTLITRKEP